MPDPADETAELLGSTRAPTTQLELFPRPAFRSSQLALVFLAVAAASFLVGLGIASTTRAKPVDVVIAEQDVGPSGGTIRFAGGELRVPDGAVAEVVHFVVRRGTVDGRVRVDAADAPLVFEPGTLMAYRFEPTGVSFSKPVEITFRLPVGARNGTVFARRGNRILLLAGVVDADRRTATTKVGDFNFTSSGR